MEKLESRKFKSFILQAWKVMEFNGLISRGLVIHKQEKINAKNQRRYVVKVKHDNGFVNESNSFRLKKQLCTCITLLDTTYIVRFPLT